MKRFLRIALVAALAAVQAWSQTSAGRISGTVSDSSGAVLPVAKLTLRNVATSETRTLTTSSAGTYEFLNVPIGDYEMTIELAGFKKEATKFRVEVQAQLVVNSTLNVGQVSEQVEVTGVVEVLNTTGATISNIVDNAKISELPLNGRSFTDLLGLQPGTTPVVNTGAGARTSDTRNAGGFVNGVEDFFNNFTIDGQDYNDVVVPGSIINKALIGTGVPPDAIQEFRVITSNEDAESGVTAGAQISVGLKSGSNQLHFALWEFFRNNAIDARNFFDRGLFFNDVNRDGRFTPGTDTAKNPPFRLNQFGFTAGAPIKKDKHFIFGAFEVYRQRLRSTRTATVPTPRLIAALPGGAANGNLRELYDAFFPDPDPGYAATALVAPLGTATSIDNDRESFIIRSDHSITNNDKLSFHLVFNQAIAGPGALLSTGIQGGNVGFDWRSQTPQLTYTRLIGNRMVNEARFGLNRHRLGASADDANNAVTALGYSPKVGDRNGVPLISATGTGLDSVGTGTNIPQGRVVNTWQLSDTLSTTIGRHSLKMGFNFLDYQANNFGQDFQRPSIAFVGFGAPFDANVNGLTTGVFSTRSQTFHINPLNSSRRYLRFKTYGFFFQDNFRLRPNLTLDLGLRYEFFPLPLEKFGVQNGLFQLDGSGKAVEGASILNNVTRVGLFRLGDNLRAGATDLNNFAPRIGLAWTPMKRLVIRTGYGISFTRPYLFGFGGTTNAPFSIPTVIRNQRFGAAIADPSQFLNLPQNVGVVDPANRTTYVQKFNVSLQLKLDSSTYVQAGYVGTHSLGLPLTFNPNFGNAFAGTRPNPAFGVISVREQIGHTTYSSLQLELNRRFKRGLSWQTSYTFGKAIGLNESYGGVTNQLNASLDRGPTDFDLKHMFINNWFYQIPLGTGHRYASGGILNHIFGRWSVAGLWWVRSGQPFSADAGVDRNGDGNTNDRAGLLTGTADGIYSTGSEKAQFTKTQAEVRNVSLSQTLGTTLGRNVFRGPRSVNVDLSLLKQIPVTESKYFQFRFEAFNLLNHTNLLNPVTSIGSPLFGVIQGTRGTSRNLQFGLKFNY